MIEHDVYAWRSLEEWMRLARDEGYELGYYDGRHRPSIPVVLDAVNGQGQRGSGY